VRIKHEKKIHVGVRIDKARGHGLAPGVDLLCPAREVFSDRGDLPAFDRHVGLEPRASRSVDNKTIFNDQIVRHGSILRSACVIPQRPEAATVL
jgi:hypothetical protein